PLSQDPRVQKGLTPIPDVAEAPGGHIWDIARKEGLTYRNYGFYVTQRVDKNKVMLIPDNYPSSVGLLPGGHDLEGVTNLDYFRFEMNYADSEASIILFNKYKNEDYLYKTRTYGQAKSPSRFSEW